jgi:dolichol-phosphate mannosyltransferase
MQEKTRGNTCSIAVLPTYNEAQNIGPLITEILNIDDKIEVLVVDDDSPDGTAQEVKRIIEKRKRVHILHRRAERGRGLAGIAGFKYAVKKGYDYIIEMDADFSHPPEYIPVLLKNIKRHDVVIGSRFTNGAVTERKSVVRNLISRAANLYIRLVLGVSTRDCTSGFRCFRKEVLEAIGLDKISSKGPAVVEEVLYNCHKHGFDISEVPIVFRNRKKGKTKLTLKELIRTMLEMPRIRRPDKI